MAARGLICVSFRFYVGDAEDTLAVWGENQWLEKLSLPLCSVTLPLIKVSK